MKKIKNEKMNSFVIGSVLAADINEFAQTQANQGFTPVGSIWSTVFVIIRILSLVGIITSLICTRKSSVKKRVLTTGIFVLIFILSFVINVVNL